MTPENVNPESGETAEFTQSSSAHHRETPPYFPADSLQTEYVIAGTQANMSAEVASHVPVSVAEYLIRGQLGRGGFGTVYLAYDQLLQREVALKIPYRMLVKQGHSADMYLSEARAMASLDHPHIVPVYCAASTPAIPCYIVTKLVRGCHLGQWYARNRPTLDRLMLVLIQVSQALSYAHQRGVVHRDIKPGNILLDESSHPYVADFGLALRDVDADGGPAYVGTAAYMSPEQARGEGHRVDGRSDIFSFGVMVYELITGQRPFAAKGRAELFDQILFLDPEHPCRVNRQLPGELANVCLKALSKSVSDRYQNFDTLAAELHNVLRSRGTGLTQVGSISPADTSSASDLQPNAAVSVSRVIPKGLRPYDTHDADFFLQLLPGARDREGLPESVHFWLNKITRQGNQANVPVGLIYGPSGCGKSSLVRAGIIPRIPVHVTAVYIAATANGTEKQLVSQIASAFPVSLGPQIHEDTSLVDAFSMVRRAKEKKLVVFIDQFEQWLFAHPECEREPLTQALRQCDGTYLQCIVLVRDDFWMGISRFLQALDITIAEDINITAVDLFDVKHARQVLHLFGAAHGRLPASLDELSVGEAKFLDDAVNYLTKDGRVVCVQLALLTEMLKNRPWNKSAGLFDQGGVGIGVRFLEETFDSESATRRISVHAEGAHRLLRTLLPEAGSRIKGAIHTAEDLLAASGYRDKHAFVQLLNILDRELHLITPTDRLDGDSLSSDSSDSSSHMAGYQLTHDFLIGPIRHWTEIRNRTNKPGKARMRLEEFAELYRARPRRQSLPNLLEFLSIRRYVPAALWTAAQQRMMAAANQHHFRSVASKLLVLGLILMLAVSVQRWVSLRKAETDGQTALQRLLAAPLATAIPLAQSLRTSPYVHDASLQLVNDQRALPADRLRAALVLRNQPMGLTLLTSYLLNAPEEECVELARRIEFTPEMLRRFILPAWNSDQDDRRQQLRAACVLANCQPSSLSVAGAEGWLTQDQDRLRLCRLLLAENPLWINRWREGFAAVAPSLVPTLVGLIKEQKGTESSLNAVNLVIGFAGNDLKLLVDLLPAARPAELALLTEAIATHGSEGVSAIEEAVQSLEADSVHVPSTRTPWGSPWWSLGMRLPRTIVESPPSDAARQLLESSQSIIRQHVILTHRLPLDQLATLATALETSGFRLATLAPYAAPGGNYCGALWVRDGLSSKFLLSCSTDEIRNANWLHREKGYLPDCLSCFRNSQGELEYGCIWINPPADAIVQDADLYIDVPQERHETEGWRPLMDRGINFPRSALHVQKPDQREYFSSIRWKTARRFLYEDAWNRNREEFDACLTHNPSLILLEGRPTLRTEPKTAGANAIWWQGLPVESRLLDNQSMADHGRHAQQMLEAGFYPTSIHAIVEQLDAPPQFGSTWWRPLRDKQQHVDKCRQKTKLAVVLFKLDEPQLAVEALCEEEDVEMRGDMIAAFGQYDLSPAWLLSKLADTRTPMLMRRSCACALALLPVETLANAERDGLQGSLCQMLAGTHDPGLRSSMLAMARAWRIDTSAAGSANDAREFSSAAGDRMIVIHPPQVVWLGSPNPEPGRDGHKEPLTPVIMDHPFAIASQEVSVEQFRAFDSNYQFAENYAPDRNCPAIGVTWLDAARYCRWLSEREGIAETQMCYPPIDQIHADMQLPDNMLVRSGYRLPTEAEWEWACRGGIREGRWFGFDPERLAEHAWTAANSDYRTHPVGRLLPNDFGLFDMLGNAIEWTNSPVEKYPTVNRQPIKASSLQGAIISDETRVVTRGGGVLYQPLDARAAQRDSQSCKDVRVYMSFRIARTQPDPLP